MATEKRFAGNEPLIKGGALTLRGVMDLVTESLNKNDNREVMLLSQGDPTGFPIFRPPIAAQEAVCGNLLSGNYNGYTSPLGLPAARRATADYLSKDLPWHLPPDDLFVTVGCTQALEAIMAALASPGVNVLLPQPGYPDYEARAVFSGLEVRHFDLVPEKGWEIDLDQIEAIADEMTVAMVIINPGNPCGNVFNYEHQKKIAETARKLGILVIADEVYGHVTFGTHPFVRMANFAKIAPIISLGSLSKRWIIPGWRIGWLSLNDVDGILTNKYGLIMDGIRAFFNISSDPATFIQAALPEILLNTPPKFYHDICAIYGASAEKCYQITNQIPGLSCPIKPEGGLFFMAKLDLTMLKGIKDDLDFCCKLAKEESVVIVPGIGFGLKNWVRLSFAADEPYIDEGYGRIRAFCERHTKQ